jgi:hypothetical protein
MRTIILGLLVLFVSNVSAQVQLVHVLKNMQQSGGYYLSVNQSNAEITYMKTDFTDSGTIKLPFNFDENMKSVQVFLLSTKTFDDDPDLDFILFTSTGTALRSDAKIYHQDGTLAYDFRTNITDYQFSIYNNDKYIIATAGIKMYFFEPSGPLNHIIGSTEIQLNINPNPVTNSISLNRMTGGTLQIFDFFGNTIRSEPFNSQNIDLSKLLPGEYVLKIIQNNEIFSGRFIKM